MADIDGLDAWLDAMDEVGASLWTKRRLIAGSLRKGAVPIEEEYENRIPVLTGEAKESVSTSVIEQTGTGAEAEIGPRKFYPKFGELGTVHQSASPRLGPAFDSREEEALETIWQHLGDGIEDAYGG